MDRDPAYSVCQLQLHLRPPNSRFCYAFWLNLYQKSPLGPFLHRFGKLLRLLCNTSCVFQLCPSSASQFHCTENERNMSPLCHSLKRPGDLDTARDRSIKIVSFLSTYPRNMNLSWILWHSCSIIPNQYVFLYIVNCSTSWSGWLCHSGGLCPSHCCVTSAPVGTGSKMKTAGAYCCHPSFKRFGTILSPNAGSKKVIFKASAMDGYWGKWGWSHLLTPG